MSNSTEVQVSSQPSAQTFSFEGRDVRVLAKEGEPWFVASDLCRALNLTNSRTALKALAEDEKGVSSTYTLGGEQQLAVVNEAGMWTLVLRCRDAVIEGTVPYRVRRWVTHEVLPAIRKTGIYVGKPFSVNPGDVLTAEEQNTLRLMLKSAVEQLPKEKQAAAMIKGWSKLKAHFGVPYREIPREEFSEAVSIVARHTAEFAEWELVDDAPKERTVNEIVDEWVEKIESPNGYPAFLFMPLVNAVLRKQGFDFTLVRDDLLPAEQAYEIETRLKRLGKLFNPFSEQFADVNGIARALRGLGPKCGMEEAGYRQLLKRVDDESILNRTSRRVHVMGAPA